MKTFDNLKDGQIIIAEDGDEMVTRFYDFYGTGEKIMCFFSEKCVYPSTEFNAGDWEVKE